MAEYTWNNTKNTINRNKDAVYKITDVNGNVRLIKDTGENFFEINPNNGSEIREIARDEASILIPNNAKPLSFEQKTELLTEFDANFDASFDPDNNSGYMPSDNLKGENRLANRQAREKSGNWKETGYKWGTEEGNTYTGIKSDPNIGGETGLEQAEFENSKYALPGNYKQFTGKQTDFPSLQSTMAPGLDQKNLVVGKGGGTWDVDSDYYMKDGTLMKDGGWFSGDTAATQADINAGIKNQASPGMTSADGWNAAGSVMKGVGGLASAYTGIKNYQLARDAHNTQKNQWQANYDQQLKAYQQNKDLANQEIKEKNRILKSRNSNRPETDYYQSI